MLALEDDLDNEGVSRDLLSFLKTAEGPREDCAVLLILPNCERSPAFAGGRVGAGGGPAVVQPSGPVD